MLRDVQKAALAFAGQPVVSTGRWGCGVFGGTPAHKFVQQLVAAMLSGSQIHFSTFGTPVSAVTIPLAPVLHSSQECQQ